MSRDKVLYPKVLPEFHFNAFWSKKKNAHTLLSRLSLTWFRAQQSSSWISTLWPS